MRLQSRFLGCGEGESGGKNSCWDTLQLVKCTADVKPVRNLTKHRRSPSCNPILIKKEILDIFGSNYIMNVYGQNQYYAP